MSTHERIHLASVLLAVGMSVLIGCRGRSPEAAESVELDTTAVTEVAPSPDAEVAVDQEAPAPPQSPPASAPPRTVAAPQPAPAVITTESQQGWQPDPEIAEPEVVVPEPVTVTLPASTLIVVETNQLLSSHSSEVGMSFSTRVSQDVAAEGHVVIPAGSQIFGRVIEAQAADKIGGRAKLALEFHTLGLDDGRRIELHAQFAEAGKSQRGKDAAIIGGATVGGVILGEAIDKGEGGIIGGVVGGIAGAVAAKKTKGKPVEVPAGTALTLQLTQPISIEVFP